MIENTDTYYNMDELWKYAKWKKPVTKDHFIYMKCPE